MSDETNDKPTPTRLVVGDTNVAAAKKEALERAGEELTARARRVHHIRKFANQHGMTAREMHVREAIASRCVCGRPGTVQIRSMVTLQDFIVRCGKIAARVLRENGGNVPTFETRFGRVVPIGEVTPCDACRPSAERAAARGPSWVHVEIIEAPKDSAPLVSVPANLRS